MKGNNPMNWLRRMAMVCTISWLAACAAPAKPSLYQQLGEYAGIEQLVRQLIFNIAEDPRIKPRFKGVNMQRFKTGLSDYICSIAGGPCRYQGEAMRVVHAGHQYTDTEFNALVDNLIRAMEMRAIPIATQNQLLALLAPSYRDVVYH